MEMEEAQKCTKPNLHEANSDVRQLHRAHIVTGDNQFTSILFLIIKDLQLKYSSAMNFFKKLISTALILINGKLSVTLHWRRNPHRLKVCSPLMKATLTWWIWLNTAQFLARIIYESWRLKFCVSMYHNLDVRGMMWCHLKTALWWVVVWN